MIAGLKGKIEDKGLNFIEIDVVGVIYKVFMAKRLLDNLVIGEEVTISTYMHVREEEMSLYGFIGKDEVRLFEMLLGVSGVGPKSALTIFNENGVKEVKGAIIRADVDFFKKVKGLGLKTAQKIIIELKNKIGSSKDLDLSSMDIDIKEDEVFLSMIQLGFDRKVIGQIMKKIPKELETTEDRLSWCLKNM